MIESNIKICCLFATHEYINNILMSKNIIENTVYLLGFSHEKYYIQIVVYFNTIYFIP